MSGDDSEQTDCGEQILIPGVKPVRLRERLLLQMQAPLGPRAAQKPMTIGLFDRTPATSSNSFDGGPDETLDRAMQLRRL